MADDVASVGSSVGSDGASNAEDASLGKQANAAWQNKASVMDGIMGVLYALTQNFKPPTSRYAAFRMLVDWAQLVTFLLNDSFPWASWALVVLRQYFAQLQLANPLRDLGYTAWSAVFWVLTVVLVGCVAICIYVAIDFQRDTFSAVWPVKVVQSVLSVFFTLFFTSSLNVFLTAIKCDYTVADPVMTGFTSDTGAAISCWTGSHAAYAVVGVLMAMLFTAIAGLLVLVDFTTDYRLHNPMAMPSSRPEFSIFIAKFLFTVVSIAFAKSPLGQAICYTLLSSYMLYVTIRYVPYLREWVNEFRAALYGVLTFVAAIGVWVVLVNDSKYDIPTIVGLAGTPFVAIAVAFVTFLRLRGADGRNFVFDSTAEAAAAAPAGFSINMGISHRRLSRVRELATAESGAGSVAGESVNTVGDLEDVVRIPALKSAREEEVDPMRFCIINLHEVPQAHMLQVRTVFSTPLDVEIASRFALQHGIRSSVTVRAADRIYRHGLSLFPQSAFLHLCYSTFLTAVNTPGSSSTTKVQVERARRAHQSFADRFAIFVRDTKRKHMAQSEAAGADQDMDLVSYVEFSHQLQLVQKTHRATLKAVRRFWKAILAIQAAGGEIAIAESSGGVDIDEAAAVEARSNAKVRNTSPPKRSKSMAKRQERAKRYLQTMRGDGVGDTTQRSQVLVDVEMLSKLFLRIDLLEDKARAIYGVLLDKYPKSPKLLRAHGRFLRDVLRERREADRCFSEAQRIDELQKEAGAGGGAPDASAMTRMTATINDSSDALIVMNERGIITTVNKPAAVMFRTNVAALVGRPVGVLMESARAAVHQHYVRSYLNTGVSHVIGKKRQVWAKRQDGTLFPVDISISQIDDGQGGIAFAGILSELPEDESVIRITVDSTGIVTNASGGVDRMFGLKVSEVLRRDLSGLIPPSDGRTHLSVVERFPEGVPRRATALHRNMSTFPVQVTLHRINVLEHLGDGETTPTARAALPSSRSFRLRARRKASAAAAAAAAGPPSGRKPESSRVSAAIAADTGGFEIYIKELVSEFGNVSISERGEIVAVSSGALKIFGYDSEEEMIGRNVNMLMPLPYRAFHDSYLRRFMTTGVAVVVGKRSRVVPGVRKDGGAISIVLEVKETTPGLNEPSGGVLRAQGDTSKHKKKDKDKGDPEDEEGFGIGRPVYKRLFTAKITIIKAEDGSFLDAEYDAGASGADQTEGGDEELPQGGGGGGCPVMHDHKKELSPSGGCPVMHDHKKELSPSGGCPVMHDHKKELSPSGGCPVIHDQPVARAEDAPERPPSQRAFSHDESPRADETAFGLDDEDKEAGGETPDATRLLGSIGRGSSSNTAHIVVKSRSSVASHAEGGNAMGGCPFHFDRSPPGDDRKPLRAMSGETPSTFDEWLRIARRNLREFDADPMKAVVLADRTSRIIYANHRVGDMFGVPSHKLIGHSVALFCPPEIAARHDELVQRYRAERKPHVIGTPGRHIVARRAGGALFPVSLLMDEADPAIKAALIVKGRQEKARRLAARKAREFLEAAEVTHASPAAPLSPALSPGSPGLDDEQDDSEKHSTDIRVVLQQCLDEACAKSGPFGEALVEGTIAFEHHRKQQMLYQNSRKEGEGAFGSIDAMSVEAGSETTSIADDDDRRGSRQHSVAGSSKDVDSDEEDELSKAGGVIKNNTYVHQYDRARPIIGFVASLYGLSELEGSMILNDELKIVHVNMSMWHVSGLYAKDCEGQSIQALFPEEDFSEILTLASVRRAREDAQSTSLSNPVSFRRGADDLVVESLMEEVRRAAAAGVNPLDSLLQGGDHDSDIESLADAAALPVGKREGGAGEMRVKLPCPEMIGRRRSMMLRHRIGDTVPVIVEFAEIHVNKGEDPRTATPLPSSLDTTMHAGRRDERKAITRAAVERSIDSFPLVPYDVYYIGRVVLATSTRKEVEDRARDVAKQVLKHRKAKERAKKEKRRRKLREKAGKDGAAPWIKQGKEIDPAKLPGQKARMGMDLAEALGLTSKGRNALPAVVPEETDGGAGDEDEHTPDTDGLTSGSALESEVITLDDDIVAEVAQDKTTDSKASAAASAMERLPSFSVYKTTTAPKVSAERLALKKAGKLHVRFTQEVVDRDEALEQQGGHKMYPKEGKTMERTKGLVRLASRGSFGSLAAQEAKKEEQGEGDDTKEKAPGGGDDDEAEEDESGSDAEPAGEDEEAKSQGDVSDSDAESTLQRHQSSKSMRSVSTSASMESKLEQFLMGDGFSDLLSATTGDGSSGESKSLQGKWLTGTSEISSVTHEDDDGARDIHYGELPSGKEADMDDDDEHRQTSKRRQLDAELARVRESHLKRLKRNQRLTSSAAALRTLALWLVVLLGSLFIVPFAFLLWAAGNHEAMIRAQFLSGHVAETLVRASITAVRLEWETAEPSHSASAYIARSVGVQPYSLAYEWTHTATGADLTRAVLVGELGVTSQEFATVLRGLAMGSQDAVAGEGGLSIATSAMSTVKFSSTPAVVPLDDRLSVLSSGLSSLKFNTHENSLMMSQYTESSSTYLDHSSSPRVEKQSVSLFDLGEFFWLSAALLSMPTNATLLAPKPASLSPAVLTPYPSSSHSAVYVNGIATSWDGRPFGVDPSSLPVAGALYPAVVASKPHAWLNETSEFEYILLNGPSSLDAALDIVTSSRQAIVLSHLDTLTWLQCVIFALQCIVPFLSVVLLLRPAFARIARERVETFRVFLRVDQSVVLRLSKLVIRVDNEASDSDSSSDDEGGSHHPAVSVGHIHSSASVKAVTERPSADQEKPMLKSPTLLQNPPPVTALTPQQSDDGKPLGKAPRVGRKTSTHSDPGDFQDVTSPDMAKRTFRALDHLASMSPDEPVSRATGYELDSKLAASVEAAQVPLSPPQSQAQPQSPPTRRRDSIIGNLAASLARLASIDMPQGPHSSEGSEEGGSSALSHRCSSLFRGCQCCCRSGGPTTSHRVPRTLQTGATAMFSIVFASFLVSLLLLLGTRSSTDALHLAGDRRTLAASVQYWALRLVADATRGASPALVEKDRSHLRLAIDDMLLAHNTIVFGSAEGASGVGATLQGRAGSGLEGQRLFQPSCLRLSARSGDCLDPQHPLAAVSRNGLHGLINQFATDAHALADQPTSALAVGPGLNEAFLRVWTLGQADLRDGLESSSLGYQESVLGQMAVRKLADSVSFLGFLAALAGVYGFLFVPFVRRLSAETARAAKIVSLLPNEVDVRKLLPRQKRASQPRPPVESGTWQRSNKVRPAP
jgi:PAS domain S-box-containing protein